MSILINSNNNSVLKWLEAKGIRGEVKSYISTRDALHKHIYGMVPLWLAAYADRVSEISLPGLSKMDRARFNAGDLSVAEMDAGGAHIVTYQVRQV